MMWPDRLRTIQVQGKSLRGYFVVLRYEFPDVVIKASEGDRDATVCADAVQHIEQRLTWASESDPLLCMCCPRTLKAGRFAVVAAAPEQPDNRQSIAFAVCRQCGGTRARVTERAHGIFRRVWPGARRIELSAVSSAGGRGRTSS